MNTTTQRGFTLIEILVVIGMLAILSSVVLVAINPLRQFAQAREIQRQNDVAAILNAVSERIADHGGKFLGPLDSTTNNCTELLPFISSSTMKSSGEDLRPCLVPDYISEMPYDPSIGSNTCTSALCNGGGEAYMTGYTIFQDPATNRVTVCAPAAAEAAIPGSVPFCQTR